MRSSWVSPPGCSSFDWKTLVANKDTEIERLKASLTRGSRIHERQLDILQKLYRHLDDAQGLLQRMTSGGRMGNELSPEEYAPKVDEAIRAAWDEFSNGRLFLPTPLIQECETFFATVFEGKRNFAFANLPALNPIQRAEFWKTAGEVAYKQVPEILKRIDEASRAVIYG